MVKVKRIKAPSDMPAEGGYVLVLYGPSAIDREHPRGRTLVVRDAISDLLLADHAQRNRFRPISQDGALSGGHMLVSECLPFAP
jgi:hypothetical protein